MPNCLLYSRSNETKIGHNPKPIKLFQDKTVSSVNYNRNLNKNLRERYDVIYMTELKNCINLIKTNYSCNPLECPSLRARLVRHRKQRHHVPGVRPEDMCQPELMHKTRMRKTDRATAPPKRESAPNKNSNSTACTARKDDHSAQTKVTITDLGRFSTDSDSQCQVKTQTVPLRHECSHATQMFDQDYPINLRPSATRAVLAPNFFTGPLKDSEELQQCNLKSGQCNTDLPLIPLRKSETHDVISNRIQDKYKEKLQEEINRWILRLPCTSHTSSCNITDKQNQIDELTETIHDLRINNFDENYEGLVKREIFNFIDAQNIWFAGTIQDQDFSKKKLCQSLWMNIEELNGKFSNTRCENNSRNYLKSCSSDKTKSSTSKSYNFNKCTVRSRNILCRRIHSKDRNRKLCDKTNKSYENKIEDEIFEWMDKYNLIIEESGMTKRIAANIMLSGLIPFLNKTLYSTNITDVKKKIIDILDDLPINLSLASSRTAQVNKFSEDLANRVNNIQEHMKMHSSCGKCTVVNRSLVDLVKQGVKPKNLEPSLSGTNLGIVLSGNEISRSSNTSKNMVELSSEENKYVINLTNLIRAWMETLPDDFNRPDNKELKEVMIRGLPRDILNLKKQVEPDENLIMRALVISWLLKFDIFEELEHAYPQMEDILRRLDEIPYATESIHQNRKGVNLVVRLLQEKRSKAERPLHIQSSLPGIEEEAEAEESDVENESARHDNEDGDEIIKAFIINYIQHNYDADDSTTRGAFAQLFKTEILNLTTPTRQEFNENMMNKPKDKLVTKNLDKELQYMTDISNWLHFLPIHNSFNTTGNKKRVEFINNLVQRLSEVPSMLSPDSLDYDGYMKSVITQYIQKLPVLEGHKDEVPLMTEQLINRIKAGKHHVTDVSQTFSSTNSSGIAEQSITDFIEDYIRLNGREIAGDDLKLEAWSTRLLKEVKDMTKGPAAFTKAEVYNKLADVSFGDEPVKRFSVKLEYAKEISDWMKNLPIINSDEAFKIRLINDLAMKVTDRDKKKANNVNEEDNMELTNYLQKWISELPLDRRHDIAVPIAIQQLLSRLNKVNANAELSKEERETSKIQSLLHETSIATCENSNCRREYEGVPSTLIVEAIDDWCSDLPLEGNNDRKETAKNDIAKKLFQKVGELNVNPRFNKDDQLYSEVLSIEIDELLQKLPRDIHLRSDKDELKEMLLQKISDAKYVIKENAAGEDYKRQLENTIEVSMPHSLLAQKDHDSGLELYKNRLAAMFILENFDHSDDEAKKQYEIKLRNEIDKYFKDLQTRTVQPLDKDLIYNELYSALFKVPIPQEHNLINEVEGVKTRCEVSRWFEELPLKPASGMGQLLEWDQIIATLAMRLHEMEKEDDCSIEKMRNEITKWLVKLPLMPGYGSQFDELVNKLLRRLKSSEDVRRCTTMRDSLLAESEDPDTTSTSTKFWINPALKQQHALPETVNYNLVKNARSYQMEQTSKLTKPIIKDEQARFTYRNNLKDVVNSILKKPLDVTEKADEFNILAEYIVDSFIEFKYNREDIEGQQFYKRKVYKIMSRILIDFKDVLKTSNLPPDPIIRGNQLMSELSKVPPVSDAEIKEEVQEIRMKKEVEEFMSNLLEDDDDDSKIRMQNTLAKRLNELEKGGHNKSNDQLMKNEITKDLRKLGTEISSERIDKFIRDLKQNESDRKAPPYKSGFSTLTAPGMIQSTGHNYTLPSTFSSSNYYPSRGNQTIPHSNYGAGIMAHPSNVYTGKDEWLSIPQSAAVDSRFHDPLNIREHTSALGEAIQQARGGVLNNSSLNYSGFGGGINLNSSRNEYLDPGIYQQTPIDQSLRDSVQPWNSLSSSFRSKTQNIAAVIQQPPVTMQFPAPPDNSFQRGGSVLPWTDLSSSGAQPFIQKAVAVVHEPPVSALQPGSSGNPAQYEYNPRCNTACSCSQPNHVSQNMTGDNIQDLGEAGSFDRLATRYLLPAAQNQPSLRPSTVDYQQFGAEVPFNSSAPRLGTAMLSQNRPDTPNYQPTSQYPTMQQMMQPNQETHEFFPNMSPPSHRNPQILQIPLPTSKSVTPSIIQDSLRPGISAMDYHRYGLAVPSSGLSGPTNTPSVFVEETRPVNEMDFQQPGRGSRAASSASSDVDTTDDEDRIFESYMNHLMRRGPFCAIRMRYCNSCEDFTPCFRPPRCMDYIDC